VSDRKILSSDVATSERFVSTDHLYFQWTLGRECTGLGRWCMDGHRWS
jgi:hypothetical protein